MNVNTHVCDSAGLCCRATEWSYKVSLGSSSCGLEMVSECGGGWSWGGSKGGPDIVQSASRGAKWVLRVNLECGGLCH